MGTTAWRKVLIPAGAIGAALVFAAASRVVDAVGAGPTALRDAAGAVAARDAAAPRVAAAGADAVTMLGVTGRASATPWVAADGRFVAVAWGASAGEKKSDLFVAVSRDGGVTFAAPVQVNVEAGEGRLGGELPPRIVLLPRASASGASRALGASDGRAAADPDVAVLWTARGATTSIKIARSRDGGRHFDTPVTLQTPGAPGDRGWPALAADPQGTLHAIWLDHRGLAAMKAGQTHGAGGHHGATPTPAAGAAGAAPAAGGGTAPPATASDAAMHDGVAMAQRSGLYYASVSSSASASATSAATASTATASTPATSTAASASSASSRAASSPDRELTAGVCYCCKTALAVRRDGLLVAAWRQVYAGNIRDIAFTTSRDGGRTFAAPLRVSEDKWEINGCPDDGPAIAVGPDDTVHLVWPTVTMQGDEPQGALFYASTRDGRTFTPRRRIPTLGSPKPMHPQLLVDAAGRITVAWDEFVDGRRVAAMRAIKPVTAEAEGGLEAGPVVTLAAGAGSADPALAAQYPILAATRDGAVAVWTSGASGTSTIAVRRLSPAPVSASAP